LWESIRGGVLEGGEIIARAACTESCFCNDETGDAVLED
jgi:hypothetical protein